MTPKYTNKIGVSEWAMTFVFTRDEGTAFHIVKTWFDNTFSREEVCSGWRVDKTSLTVFLKTERAYALSLLKWA
jgi:hypothetical protein